MAKLTIEWDLNLKIPGAERKVDKASREGLRDTIVAIHGDAIKNARAVGFWLTGHNARSIASEVSGMGVVKKGEDAEPERVVDDS